MNQRGSLGNGTAHDANSVPTRVRSDVEFAAVDAGASHSCGLDLNGTAFCWGRNEEGQLGDGSRLDKLLPRAAADGLSFVSISAGSLHSCGVTKARAVYCWGSSRREEFGTTVAESDRPVLFAGGPGDAVDPQRKMRALVEAGDAAALSALLLGKQADIDVPGPDGRTNLHVALAAGNYPAAESLLAGGADPNAWTIETSASQTSESALTIALSGGRPDLVQLLLDGGADPDARSPYDSGTALHRAAENGSVDAVSTLIQANADPNARESYLRTPLHMATASGSLEIVVRLLEAGADPNAMHVGEDTALHIAAKDGREDIVEALLEAGADVNRRDRRGRNSLQVAELNTHINLVDMLARRGATREREDEENHTPLYLAAESGDVAAVAEAIRDGFDVHARFKDYADDCAPRAQRGPQGPRSVQLLN